MALYVISSLTMLHKGEEKFIKSYMQVVVTSMPNSEEKAREIFETTFQSGPEVVAGWTLIGEPLFVELNQGHFAEWGKWISPAPTTEKIKTHLRLVKE